MASHSFTLQLLLAVFALIVGLGQTDAKCTKGLANVVKRADDDGMTFLALPTGGKAVKAEAIKVTKPVAKKTTSPPPHKTTTPPRKMTTKKSSTHKASSTTHTSMKLTPTSSKLSTTSTLTTALVTVSTTTSSSTASASSVNQYTKINYSLYKNNGTNPYYYAASENGTINFDTFSALWVKKCKNTVGPRGFHHHTSVENAGDLTAWAYCQAVEKNPDGGAYYNSSAPWNSACPTGPIWDFTNEIATKLLIDYTLPFGTLVEPTGCPYVTYPAYNSSYHVAA